MIKAYVIGVMHERQSAPLTDDPEEMAKQWVDNLLKELDKIND